MEFNFNNQFDLVKYLTVVIFFLRKLRRKEVNSKFLLVQLLLMLSDTDILSKFIIAILVIFSIVSWTLIFGKISKIISINSKNDKFIKTFWSGENIYDIYQKYKSNVNCPTVSVFFGVMKDIDDIVKTKDDISVEYAAEKAYDKMTVTISTTMQKIRSGMQYMNVIATTSTYFGLLGTVWGISQSFKTISIMKEATIANLAPGVNAALVTTILGLVSAVPALIAYQLINYKLNLIEENLNNFSLEFLGVLSKELEKDED